MSRHIERLRPFLIAYLVPGNGINRIVATIESHVLSILEETGDEGQVVVNGTVNNAKP